MKHSRQVITLPLLLVVPHVGGAADLQAFPLYQSLSAKFTKLHQSNHVH